jgi:hypothetical protein
MNVWIFVTNRDTYPQIDQDWAQARANMAWIVKQHKEELKAAVGDVVFIYLAEVGIIGRAELTGTPNGNLDLSGWTAEARKDLVGMEQVPMTVGKWLLGKQAISFARLKNRVLDPNGRFAKMNGNGTNFRLSDDEGQKLEVLWKERLAVEP